MPYAIRMTCPVIRVLLLALLFTLGAGTLRANDFYNADILLVKGNIKNSHGNPVQDVRIRPTVRNQQTELKKQALTDANGNFAFEELFAAGTLVAAKVFLEARKPS